MSTKKEMDMFEKDYETYCMTLRGLRCETADVLYGLKTLRGLPLYQLVDEIVAYYVQHHPSMLQQRLEEVRLLAAEYGGTSPAR
jgi:hypothetical protein